MKVYILFQRKTILDVFADEQDARDERDGIAEANPHIPYTVKEFEVIE